MMFRRVLVCILFAAPALSFGASKEIMELQRDVALLQQQIKDLQRSQDDKFAAFRCWCSRPSTAPTKRIHPSP